MRRARWTMTPWIALLLAGCGADIQLATPPFSQPIPVTSAFTTSYAEIAVDIPSEVQANAQYITVNSIDVTGSLQNKASATTLQVGLWLSFTGTATPNVPFLFTDINRPAYFANATRLVSTSVSPGGTVNADITNPALNKVVTQPRIWLIASNTVTNIGLGDVFPLEVDVNNVVIHASVHKSFDGLTGAQDVSGL